MGVSGDGAEVSDIRGQPEVLQGAASRKYDRNASSTSEAWLTDRRREILA